MTYACQELTERQLESLQGDPVVLSAIAMQSKMLAQQRLIQFTKYTMPRYQMSWHHEETARLLERVSVGDLTRLMIFEPPRHGKSELSSIRFPIWHLGRNPQDSVIGCSYALDLARTFSRAARNVLMDEAYQRLWPLRLETEGDTGWMIAGKQDERNSFIAAGVGGPITGQGADLLIIDDPFKNYEEALSQVTRDTVWNWYTSTARTRLAKDGRVILTMTRWHEDDLAGRLLSLAKQDKKADQWTVLELPAECGEFEPKLWTTDGSYPVKRFPAYTALWPEMYDAEYLASTRATQGSRQYSALYGGSPKEASGNDFKREWFCRWYVTPGDVVPRDGTGLRPGYAFESCEVLDPHDDDHWDEVVLSGDLSFKDRATSDFVSLGCWAKRKVESLKQANYYLLDRDTRRLNYPDTKTALRAMAVKWPRARRKYIEDKANGPAIISELSGEIEGIIAVEPLGSKQARASAASAPFESHNVILPHPSIAPWVYDYIECLCVFPNGVHDDDVDMTSQAIVKLRTAGEGMIGMWQQQIREAKHAQALPDDGGRAAQKEQGGWEMKTTKTLGKVATCDKTKACPDCGNKILSRYSEGKWKCNACGKSGQDQQAGAA